MDWWQYRADDNIRMMKSSYYSHYKFISIPSAEFTYIKSQAFFSAWFIEYFCDRWVSRKPIHDLTNDKHLDTFSNPTGAAILD